MSDLSRREFLRKGSLGVAAGVVAAELAASTGIAKAVMARGGKAASNPASNPADETATEPIVAYVKQGSRGEVRVMVGSREIVHRDPELAGRILRAAR